MKLKRWIPTLLVAGSTLLAGCGSSNNWDDIGGQPGGPVSPIGSKPVAVDDLYSTDEGQSFTVAAAQGVLANDQLNTNNFASVSVTFPSTTTQGGSISNVANSGAFTYTPALGFTGTDSFTYTLNTIFGSDSATVSIVVDTAVVTQGYFVDSAAGSDTTGDFQTGSPFATIQGAVAAAPVNADVIVRPGNYSGAVTLKNGQRLWGTPGGQRPVISGRIILADGNTVDFLRIQDSPDDAIDGDNRNGGTITNCEVTGTTNQGAGIKANDATGNWIVTGNTISNTAGLSIDLTTSGTGQMRARVNDNTITGSDFDAIGFLAEDDSQLVAQVHGNTMTGNQAGATFEAIAGNNATLSLDIEDNTNDDVYVFSAQDASVLNVEQLSQIVAINNSRGRVVIDSGGIFIPPVEVPNGFCGF